MYFACQHTEEVNIVPAQKNSRSVLCLLSVKTELPAIKTYISTIVYKIRFRRRKNVLLQIKTIELNFLRSQITLHHTEDIIFSSRNRYHCSHQKAENNVRKNRIRHRTTPNFELHRFNRFGEIHHLISESFYVGFDSFRHWFQK